MMYDEFNFLEDGTGHWRRESGSGSDTIHFKWKVTAPLHVEIKEDEYEGQVGFDYEFKRMTNDISSEIYLCRKGEKQFYDAVTRIGLEGRPK